MNTHADYARWMADYVTSVGGHKKTHGKCGAATTSMVEAFPELRAVYGHIETSWGRRSHWWCVTPDGDVLDPTIGQFDALFGEYEELLEGDDERLGKCMNCGDEIWGPRGQDICNCICSRRCAEVFNREQMGEELPADHPGKYIKDMRPTPEEDDEEQECA
jgi:hypothetical protein